MVRRIRLYRKHLVGGRIGHLRGAERLDSERGPSTTSGRPKRRSTPSRRAGRSIWIRSLQLGEQTGVWKGSFGIGRPEVDDLADRIGEHADPVIEERGLGAFLYEARGDDAVQLDTNICMSIPRRTAVLGKSIVVPRPREGAETTIDPHGPPEGRRVRSRTGWSRSTRVEGRRRVPVPITDDGGCAIEIGASRRPRAGRTNCASPKRFRNRFFGRRTSSRSTARTRSTRGRVRSRATAPGGPGGSNSHARAARRRVAEPPSFGRTGTAGTGPGPHQLPDRIRRGRLGVVLGGAARDAPTVEAPTRRPSVSGEKSHRLSIYWKWIVPTPIVVRGRRTCGPDVAPRRPTA